MSVKKIKGTQGYLHTKWTCELEGGKVSGFPETLGFGDCGQGKSKNHRKN